MKQKSNETKAKEFIKNSLKARQRTSKVFTTVLPGESQFASMQSKIQKGQ